MDGKEIRFWYPKKLWYEEVGAGLLILLIGFFTWIFLSSSYEKCLKAKQIHQNLLRQKTAIFSLTSSPQAVTQKSLLKTEKSEDFIQKLSDWVEAQTLSLENLSVVSSEEGLLMDLKFSGSREAVLNFLIQWTRQNFLLNESKILLTESEEEGLQCELSGVLRRSSQGQFFCEDPFRYQAWIRVMTEASLKPLATWIYQENACGSRRFNLEKA